MMQSTSSVPPVPSAVSQPAPSNLTPSPQVAPRPPEPMPFPREAALRRVAELGYN